MNDLISVVLPIYNVEKYLRNCIDSVIKQTYKNLEIILVNDGSTDNSLVICKEYEKVDSRIVVINKTNGGLSDARNCGIDKSKGKYITFIDSDDYVDLDMINYLYLLIKKNNTNMSICQHRVLFDNGKNIDYGKYGDEVLSGEQCIERMLYHDVIDTSAWAKLYAINLFDDVRYPKGKLFEDIGTTYKLWLKCPTVAVGYESKYNYIYRSSSIVNSHFKKSKLDLLDMTDEMAKDVLVAYPNLQPAVLRRQIYARFSTLNQMLDVKDYNREKEEIIHFLKKNKNVVLKNPKCPRRDRMAYNLLSLGYPFYKIGWKMYLKLKKSV